MGDWLALELAVLRFYPNHIEGVIQQTLGGRTIKSDRLAKAQVQGWDYFNKPVWSLLAKRAGAIRPDGAVVQPTETLERIYNSVCSMVDTDMTRREVLHLFLDVPGLIRTQSDLRSAVQICRTAGARTVFYLVGVLRKDQQRRQTKIVEVLETRAEQEPWKPPTKHSAPDADKLQDRWRRLTQ